MKIKKLCIYSNTIAYYDLKLAKSFFSNNNIVKYWILALGLHYFKGTFWEAYNRGTYNGGGGGGGFSVTENE